MGVGTFLGVVANATEMMLNRRERQTRLTKLNMVIGLFFSEIGTKLLGYFAAFDLQADSLRNELLIVDGWSDSAFLEVGKTLKNHSYDVDITRVPQAELMRFFAAKSDLLLRLLEHPHLLEQESFAELIRAIFHVRDELLHRDDIRQLPETDTAHLAGDIRRAYRLLAHHWLDYMKYLKEHYPYLFSLAVRTNPFDPEASAIVR